MEIIPGVGFEVVKVGDTREDVERRLGAGPPKSPRPRVVHYDSPPGLVVYYGADHTVEGVAQASDPRDEVTYDGIRLTGRFLDDVLADLAARGLTSTPSDVGRDFHAGFSVFSMGSADGASLGLTDDPDDERLVSEGVHVAPYDTIVG